MPIPLRADFDAALVWLLTERDTDVVRPLWRYISSWAGRPEGRCELARNWVL
jgi:hypothetical protein